MIPSRTISNIQTFLGKKAYRFEIGACLIGLRKNFAIAKKLILFIY